jgi:hypothetical protein
LNNLLHGRIGPVISLRSISREKSILLPVPSNVLAVTNLRQQRLDHAQFQFERVLVSDPDFSPLDLAIAPNGNVVVSSEHPFGAADAVTSVREYDNTDGHLVRVFSPTKLVELRKPRGLRFGPDGHLYCVAQDEVVAFDFTKGACLGTTVQFQRLNGQALAFFP